MIAHVILKFADIQSYQQAMWNIYKSIPQLVDWEEIEIYEEEDE